MSLATSTRMWLVRTHKSKMIHNVSTKCIYIQIVHSNAFTGSKSQDSSRLKRLSPGSSSAWWGSYNVFNTRTSEEHGTRDCIQTHTMYALYPYWMFMCRMGKSWYSPKNVWPQIQKPDIRDHQWHQFGTTASKLDAAAGWEFSAASSVISSASSLTSSASSSSSSWPMDQCTVATKNKDDKLTLATSYWHI